MSPGRSRVATADVERPTGGGAAQTSHTTESTMTYRLSCNDCSFETELDVDVDAIYDVIEEHRSEYAADRSAHHVDFERITSSV